MLIASAISNRQQKKATFFVAVSFFAPLKIGTVLEVLHRWLAKSVVSFFLSPPRTGRREAAARFGGVISLFSY